MNSFKINSNTYAMDALRQLNAVNSKVAMHQARLSTGKRINNAQHDAAAYAVSQKTIARMEGLDVSKDNIQNAKASLQLVEQGQFKQLEILQSIKQKVLQLPCTFSNSDSSTPLNRKIKSQSNIQLAGTHVKRTSVKEGSVSSSINNFAQI